MAVSVVLIANKIKGVRVDYLIANRPVFLWKFNSTQLFCLFKIDHKAIKVHTSPRHTLDSSFFAFTSLFTGLMAALALLVQYARYFTENHVRVKLKHRNSHRLEFTQISGNRKYFRKPIGFNGYIKPLYQLH